MARRNTPPRGSGPPLYGGGGRPGDRGRPTVQELSALEVVVAVERAREQQRYRSRPEQPTRKEPLYEGPTTPDMSSRPPAAETTPEVPAVLRRHEHEPLPREPSRALPRVEPLPRIAELGPELSERPTLRVDMSDETLAEVAPPREEPGRSMVLSGAPRDLALFHDEEEERPRPQSSVRALPLRPGAEADLRLVMQREPDSPRAAAFRVLRYRIEQQEGDTLGTRVIALCAPRPGQGSTSAAANLALALAECDRARVCLLEGNLRRPALANLFRFKPPMCLADRLAQDRDEPLKPWCVAELSPSLHVMAVRETGPRRPLVDGPAFAAAVEAMRRAGYRYVIIDGPEVLGIADMNLIEENADDVLLVAKGATTTAADLKAASTQLSSRKLRGIVLLDSE
jgi:Mrp family chromosome partitioning ATPase